MVATSGSQDIGNGDLVSAHVGLLAIGFIGRAVGSGFKVIGTESPNHCPTSLIALLPKAGCKPSPGVPSGLEVLAFSG
jgi:hypothetical protein